jgi:Multicopper oxidase
MGARRNPRPADSRVRGRSDAHYQWLPRRQHADVDDEERRACPLVPIFESQRGRRAQISIARSDSDVHAYAHGHGDLLPMTMLIADMVPDSPGTWLFHCHLNAHLEGGMVTRFTVTP